MDNKPSTIGELQDEGMTERSGNGSAAENGGLRQSRAISLDFLRSRAKDREQRREANGSALPRSHDHPDLETDSFSTQAIIAGDNPRTRLLESTPEENAGGLKHRSTLEESIGYYAAATPSLLQAPSITITSPTSDANSSEAKPPRELNGFADPKAPPSSASEAEAGQYGTILHDTLVVLVDKQQCIVEMEKDLRVAQEKLLHAQDEVVRAQQVVVDSQGRIVMAHEELVRALGVQLNKMQRLQGKTGSK